MEQAKCIIIFGTNLVIQRKMIARFSTPYVVLNFATIFSAKLSTNKVVIQWHDFCSKRAEILQCWLLRDFLLFCPYFASQIIELVGGMR